MLTSKTVYLCHLLSYPKSTKGQHPPHRDVSGVGKLVSMAVKLGRGLNSKLKIGICGEHGGDPSSIEFCKETGLDYVSCSPFRVLIARLAAAQASIRDYND